jgi:pyruvate,orthophosphate dikinase
MIQTARSIYRFGNGAADGNGKMVELLGGKGAGLAEMTRLSFPVPPGFTISTDICRSYLAQGVFPADLAVELREAVAWLEDISAQRLGDPGDPLLVSVRSGAAISMPGMMDTILNVGLNDACVEGLVEQSGSARFAYDSYRRLLQMFGSVVMGVPKELFDRAFEQTTQAGGAAHESELTEEALRGVVSIFKDLILKHTGKPFPQDPQQQLAMAIETVFDSWRSERAVFYRRLNGISENMGTAVTVQAMVFGNRGADSGTGVGFSRNPSSGDKHIFGEYLCDAQGEDIVAGTRTPTHIYELEKNSPKLYAELRDLVAHLERHYRDVQDFEFTVENGRLFLLQTRSAKRAALAAVQTAVDMVEEGLITKREAIARVKAESIAEILSPQLDLHADSPAPLAHGLPASPGAAVGKIALSTAEAVSMAARGDSVVLVTEETTADDIEGMSVAVGFLTARGGATSHAAVVARGMGKCCITGARAIRMVEGGASVWIGEKLLHAGDWLSLEGSTGRIFEGKLPTRAASTELPALNKFLTWASEVSTSVVRANADTPADAKAALAAGAKGIGLCRTEHMFFAPDRLIAMRAMILASTVEDRIKALDQLLPMQQSDFEKLYRSMPGLPVTIRLLDPPLHEFLPSPEEIDLQIAAAREDENWDQSIALEHERRHIESLSEANPMMGHRGCRLSLTYPEILQMQVRAILQAALAVASDGLDPLPEIMVPLVSSEEEMIVLARLIRETADEVFTRQGKVIPYTIGTMVELPRAAVCAAAIARHVSFISFGTNDLTQMTFGFSRDDARNYLDHYLEKGIFKSDPFVTIDKEGVGYLIDLAIRQVRLVDPKIKIGVCGEHGGDPESIRFFHSLGVDYVSCSVARLPIAQVAMAQASQKADVTPYPLKAHPANDQPAVQHELIAELKTA